jgi:hypothetical protein
MVVVMTASTDSPTAASTGTFRGKPAYGWECAPDHLRTEPQLRAEGLRPARAGEPDAYVVYGRRSRRKHIRLFDQAAALPARALTEAQLAGRAKGAVTRRTCSICGRDTGRQLSREDRARGCGPCQATRAHREVTDWARRLLADPDVVLLEVVPLDENVGQLDGLRVAAVDTAGRNLLTSELRPRRDRLALLRGPLPEPLDQWPTTARGDVVQLLHGGDRLALLTELELLLGKRVVSWQHSTVYSGLETALARLWPHVGQYDMPPGWTDWVDTHGLGTRYSGLEPNVRLQLARWSSAARHHPAMARLDDVVPDDLAYPDAACLAVFTMLSTMAEHGPCTACDAPTGR